MNKPIKRAKSLEHFASRAPCLIMMEVCSGAHHLAMQNAKIGDEIKPIPANFATVFNIRNKNDAADARAIWLAVQQSGKAIAVKTGVQQAMLALHQMRQQLLKFRTMQITNLRGLLTEYGEVIGKSCSARQGDSGIAGTGRRATACGRDRHVVNRPDFGLTPESWTLKR